MVQLLQPFWIFVGWLISLKNFFDDLVKNRHSKIMNQFLLGSKFHENLLHHTRKRAARKVQVNLCRAVKENDIDMVRRILEENPEAAGWRHPIGEVPKKVAKMSPNSPLWEAMLLRHSEVVKLLIHHGACRRQRKSDFEKK